MPLSRWILCAALAMPFAPAPSPTASAVLPDSDAPARVVRVDSSPDRLAAARARVRSRGGRTDLVIWNSSDSDVVGAAPDSTIRELEAEGLRIDRLFGSIVDFQAARSAGDAGAMGFEQAAGPRLAERVVVIDLAASKPDAWLGDPETVLRTNDRYVAILDAADARDPDGRLAAQYAARGLVLAAAAPLADFPAASLEFFPENPFGPSDVAGLTKQMEGEYTSYAEATEGLEQLAADYPALVKLTSAGKSYEGRELWAIKISAGAAVDDPDKPDVLVTGLYHAREWIAAEVPYRLALRLPELYESDSRVRFLLDRVEVWVVPIVNPDGLAYSQGAPNHTTNDIRFWRKNRRPIDLDEDGDLEGLGVDLNRNHGQNWRVGTDQPYPATGDDYGASDDPDNFQTYRGPAPNSEPEVRALNALTADPAHQFAARLDFHNYGQLVLYPYGASNTRSPDHTVLAEFARSLANTIRAASGTSYTPMPAFGLYPATGSSTDYAYGTDRQLAFTIELSPAAAGFDLPEELIDRVVGETIPAAVSLVDWATGAATVASVTASQGGATVFAGRWERAGDTRTFAMDRWAPIAAGPLDVAVTFSRPLVAAPQVTVRSGARQFPIAMNEGAAAAYAGDTWTATIAIRDGDDGISIELGADAGAAGPVGLDADPSTVAAFTIGSGAWVGLETASSRASYALRLPSGQDARPIARLTSPGAAGPTPDGLPSEIFAAGTEVPVTWSSSDDRGVVEQRLDFSVDGGATWLPTGLAIDPGAQAASWTSPAELSSAALLMRLTVVDPSGNVAQSVSAHPIAVSRLTIAGPPSMKKAKLRIPVPPGALRMASSVAVQLNGTQIDASAVRWRASAPRVNVRGTLESLGLQPGVVASVRLLVDGVPTPAMDFTP